MGFPLRSNIFMPGSLEQSYFAGFPLQVAVLYSPRDREFSKAFREIFLHLDKLTGKQVALFAVLDPPPDWLEAAEQRPWWQRYRQAVGETGFTVAHLPLIREIARLFQVEWDHLPSLVVSPNLWDAEFVLSETSSAVIERQLRELTELAKEANPPEYGKIIGTLQGIGGCEVRNPPRDPRLQRSLGTFYAYLDSAALVEGDRQRAFANLLARELAHGHARRIYDHGQGESAGKAIVDAVDFALEAGAGSLIEPATVAAKILAEARTSQADSNFSLKFSRMATVTAVLSAINAEVELIDALDDESRVMIEGSVLIGDLLNALGDAEAAPILVGSARYDITKRRADFSPAGQGMWKSFEREVNLSAIQAAREARRIPMPEYFAMFKPRHSGALRIVKTPKPIDINQKDTKHGNRLPMPQRFIALGDAWHVIDTLQNSPDKQIQPVIERCLGPGCTELPTQLMLGWKRIYEIRNPASHGEVLSQAEYEEVATLALSPTNLRPLLTIKRTLSQKPSSINRS